MNDFLRRCNCVSPDKGQCEQCIREAAPRREPQAKPQARPGTLDWVKFLRTGR